PGSRCTAYLPGVARTLTAGRGGADGPGAAVDEYEAGCRRSDESADPHRSTLPTETTNSSGVMHGPHPYRAVRNPRPRRAGARRPRRGPGGVPVRRLAG